MAVTLLHGDALEVLRTLPDNSVDAIVTDPPYGMNLGEISGGPRSALATSRASYSIYGDDKPFDPSPFLNFKTVVMFGANYYAQQLPSSGAWIVWDKLDGLTSKREIGFNDNSDCELIWTNAGNAARIIRHRWMGAMKGSEQQERRVHPTQKPVWLMVQIIKHYTKEGDTVFDPFMGSGTTGVACVQTGRNFIGCEIDAGYFAIAQKRIADAQMQPALLGVQE